MPATRARQLPSPNTSGLSLPASTFSANVNNLTINGAGGVTLGSATTVAGYAHTDQRSVRSRNKYFNAEWHSERLHQDRLPVVLRGQWIYGSGSAQTILAANYGNLTSSGAGARS